MRTGLCCSAETLPCRSRSTELEPMWVMTVPGAGGSSPSHPGSFCPSSPSLGCFTRRGRFQVAFRESGLQQKARCLKLLRAVRDVRMCRLGRCAGTAGDPVLPAGFRVELFEACFGMDSGGVVPCFVFGSESASIEKKLAVTALDGDLSHLSDPCNRRGVSTSSDCLSASRFPEAAIATRRCSAQQLLVSSYVLTA